MIEDSTNCAFDAKLLRFCTSEENTDDPYDMASLDKFLARKKEDQKQDQIYYHYGNDLWQRLVATT